MVKGTGATVFPPFPDSIKKETGEGFGKEDCHGQKISACEN